MMAEEQRAGVAAARAAEEGGARKARRVRCPVAATLAIVGDRWTLQVVRDLLRGRTRFTQLAESVEGIPPAILTKRLRLLEAHGIISRRPYGDHSQRFEYVLTQKGHGLGVVVGALSAWGERYLEHDLALVDEACGHGVTVVYHCPVCAREAPRRRVRMVPQADLSARSGSGSGPGPEGASAS